MKSDKTILLTNTYFYPLDKKQWETAQPYPPLGTLWATSTLREAGYAVSFLDNCLETTTYNFSEALETYSPDIVIIYDDGFNYLTKMCLTVMRDACFEMIEAAKEKNCQIIVSSSDSTDHYGQYLEKGADVILLGEGEETLKELIPALRTEVSKDNILGIAYKDALGIVKRNERRPVIKELDSIALPAWDLVDIEPYRKIWLDRHGYFTLNIATTRGCPYKCNWCAKPIYGNRYNSRTPEQVIEEIEWVQSLFGVHYFWMCDDIFGLKPNWVQQFLALKKERKLSFRYKIQSRADLMLKDNNLDALADSGADIIWLGAESGSQAILDAMDKGTTIEQIYTATRNLKARDVRVAFFLQFGYPGEGFDDIMKTMKMVLDLMPDEIGISVSYPLPGTTFYENVKHELSQKANWSDSDDLDLMFSNTYPPIFYKTLHRYVHSRYNIRKGRNAMYNILRGRLKGSGRKLLKMGYHLPLTLHRRWLLHKYAKQGKV